MDSSAADLRPSVVVTPRSLGSGNADPEGLLRAARGASARISGTSPVDADFSGTVPVNAARGDLVDEAAVACALPAGRLRAAAVDVPASEPAGASPLLQAPNAIVAPHLAARTTEAVDRVGTGAAEEAVRALSGREPLHPVPLPP